MAKCIFYYLLPYIHLDHAVLDTHMCTHTVVKHDCAALFPSHGNI